MADATGESKWSTTHTVICVLLLVLLIIIIIGCMIGSKQDNLYPVWWTGFPFFNYPVHTTIWNPRHECYKKCQEVGIEHGLNMDKCYQKCGDRPSMPIANYYID